MADVNRIVAEKRSEFGKGAARRIRRAHKVPAVLYGHGHDPVHLTLPGHETQLALRQQNVLLTLDVDGDEQLALPRQVQRHPLTGHLEHVDLIIVRRGEKVNVEIQIHTRGEAVPDSLVVLEIQALPVVAEATRIPEGVELDIEGMEPGQQIHAKDIRLPDGTELDIDGDQLVVNVTNAPTAEEIEADTEGAEEAVEGAEGEESEEAAGEGAEGGEAAEGSDSE